MAGIQLANRILLVASLIRTRDDLTSRQPGSTGISNVEEVANLLEKELLAALDIDLFANCYHTVYSRALSWLIIKLRIRLASQLLVSVALGLDKRFLVVGASCARFCNRWPASPKRRPLRIFQRIGKFDQVRHGVNAEHKLDALIVPAIEVLG